MTLLDLINFSSLKRTPVHDIDARIKLFMVLYYLMVSILVSDLVIIGLNLLVIISIIIYNFGTRTLLSLLWTLRYFFILIPMIFYITSDFVPLSVLSIILKLLVIILGFQIFSNSTSPDEVVDGLIKVKIPPKLAWMVGASLRQSIFLIEDLEEVMGIHDIRRRFEERKSATGIFGTIKNKAERTLPLIGVAMTRAVINARDFGDMLYIRGWKEAHPEITLHTSSINKKDLYFLFLSTFLPFIITIISLFVKLI